MVSEWDTYIKSIDFWFPSSVGSLTRLAEPRDSVDVSSPCNPGLVKRSEDLKLPSVEQSTFIKLICNTLIG